MKKTIEEEIAIPDGVTTSYESRVVMVKGPKGELKRELFSPKITINANKTIKLVCKDATQREKKLLYTFKAHINNMIKGVQEPFTYKLKVCSGHFPMTVTANNNQFMVKNFLGEKVPREFTVNPDVQVKIEGTDVLVESTDKELAGQTASKIELLTKVKGRDLRIFQDGIYIIDKAGKLIQ